MEHKTLLYNARLVDETMDREHSALIIADGTIEKILTDKEAAPLVQAALQQKTGPGKNGPSRNGSSGDLELYDAQGHTVMPAFVDMHAHFRDPGLTQKEDLASGSRAAAAGGFGSLVLMPNTSPVISSQEAALSNNRRGAEIGLAELFQSVSITRDFGGTDISHLEELDARLVPLITEDGHEVQDSAVMFRAMQVAAQKKLIVSCHCEDPFLAAAARPVRTAALAEFAKGKREEAARLLARADELLRLAEDTATDRNIRLAAQAGCHLHLCHVSTAHCLEAAIRAKKAGQDLSLEVTPHHIGLTGEAMPGIFNIVNPPLRAEEDRQALIEALISGDADAIATDHAPHTAEDKRKGSPGFSGLETAFAVCYTNLVLDSGMDLRTLSARMSAVPARLLSLNDRGLLKAGCRADLVIVDPEQCRTVRGEAFQSRGKYTPWEGSELTGQVTATFHAGRKVYGS
ncbi:MAG: dihydroorotase [Treponema sp.]|nr:dihydroorotase [Treponema sp.]